jgi:hypothetical protein
MAAAIYNNGAGVGGACPGCFLGAKAVYEEGKLSNAPLRNDSYFLHASELP